MLFNLWARLSYFLKDYGLYIIILTLSFFCLVFTLFKIYKSKFEIKKKKIFIAFAFSVFALILTYCSFEAYFRYVYDESDGLGFLKVNQRWHDRHNVYNNYFFRDRNFDEKKDGIIRIGVLGDSLTEGAGIKNVEDRFSNLLEKKLKEENSNVQIYNLGKAGLDTVQEVQSYQKLRHLKFDILVWEYFINDIQPEMGTGRPIIEKSSQTGKIVSFLSSKSFFFDYLYWRLSSRYQATFQQLMNADVNQYSNQPLVEKHFKDISSFMQVLQKDNTKAVVIMFPSISLLGPDYPQNIHATMKEQFEKNGAIFIDLFPHLKNKDKKGLMASKFDTHPNEVVHTLAAEKLFEVIHPLLSLKSN